MKKYRVYQDGMECKANGHDISDLNYIKSQIDYLNGKGKLLGEFDTEDEAREFAITKAKSLRLYEFSNAGRRFAFDWIYVESWEIEYDEDGDVEYEESGDLLLELLDGAF